MLLDNVYQKLTALAVACLIVSPANGQETVESSPQAANPATLTADGQLTGNIMVANAAKVDEAPVATVSLVSQGKVIDSVKTDAAGQFSFANVHPGPYQVVGTAQGLVGSQAFQVAPFTNSQPVTSGQLMLQPSSATGAYSTCSSVPLSTMSSTCSTGSCAGGGGRAFGGSLGGRLGGGFLRSPRGLMMIGGIAGGLAVINDGSSQDDASPDQ